MKHYIQRWIATTATALGFLFTQHAVADPIFVTPVDGTFFNYNFSNSFSEATDFIDEFFFSSPPPTSTLLISFGSFASLAYSSIVLTIFGETDPILLDGGFGPAGGWGATFFPLDSAAYLLTISGSAAAGASYFGTMTATAIDYPTDPTPVPEPSSAALLLLGMAVSVYVRRKHHFGMKSPARTV